LTDLKKAGTVSPCPLRRKAGKAKRNRKNERRTKKVTRIYGNPFAGSEVTTVYGYLGSEAQTLAAIGGYQFIQISDAWIASH